MNRLLQFTIASLAAVGAAFAQPVIKADATGVVNNASYAARGLPNSGIAQGSFFVIFGSNLGPASLVRLQNYPFTTSLSNVSAKVTVGGVTKDVYIWYALAGQVGAVMPSDVPTGTGTITLTYNGQTSTSVPVTVVKSQFGIFTQNQQGSGPAAATDAVTGAPITLTNAAHPKQFITIWGTGLGPVDPATEATKPPTANTPTTVVKVYVGGKEATVQYAGRSSFTALDQINIQVPEGVEGCYVPIMVQAADTYSNYSSIAVASSGNVCSDPLTFSAQQLQAAQANGNLKEGSIVLNRLNESFSVLGQTISGTIDSASATFGKYDYSQLLASSGVAGGQLSVSSFGSCTVFTFSGSAIATPVDAIKPTGLDAGPVLTITGPKGTAQLKQSTTAPGEYDTDGNLGGGITIPGFPSTAKPLFLEPGSYSIDNGSGGSAVGRFKVDFTLPSFVTWTNIDAVNTINRSAGVDITWSGGDPTGAVLISGTSVATSATNSPGAGFVCLAQNSAKHFTVPASVLLALPATAASTDITSFNGYMLVTGGNVQASFTATGLDKGTVLVDGGNAKPVTFQ